MNQKPCACKNCDKTVAFQCDHVKNHHHHQPCPKKRSMTFMELADVYARYYTTDGISVYEAPSVTNDRSRASSRAPSREPSPSSRARSRPGSPRSKSSPSGRSPADSPRSRSSPTRNQLSTPGKTRYRSPTQSYVRSKSTDQYRNRSPYTNQPRSQSFGRNQNRNVSPKVSPTRKQSPKGKPQRSRPYTPKTSTRSPKRNISPGNCCKCCESMDRLIQQLREKCAKYSKSAAYDDVRRVRSAHQGGTSHNRWKEEKPTKNEYCICGKCLKQQMEAASKPPQTKQCVCCKRSVVPQEEVRRAQSQRCVCCQCRVDTMQPMEIQTETQTDCCPCCTCNGKTKSAKEIFRERDLNNFLYVDSHKKPIHPRKTSKKNKKIGTRSKTPSVSTERDQANCTCYVKLKEAVKELVSEPNDKSQRPPDFDYPDYPDYDEEASKPCCVCCQCSSKEPSRKSHGDKVVYDEPLDGDNYVIINYDDVGVCVYVHKKTSQERIKSNKQRKKHR